MADTKRERILAAIKDILETSLLTTQAGVFVLTQSGDQLITDNELNATVYRSRVEPLTRGETPAVIIEPVNDQPNDTNYYDQLDFVSEETLNGECLDIVPDRVDFSLFEADVPLAVVSQDFLVRYRTARTSG
jgi:hypothetical protein